MAIKWGSTYVTTVKWGNTACTQVKWGNTVVFPTGGFDGSSFFYPLQSGFQVNAGGGDSSTPDEDYANVSASGGSISKTRTSRITRTYDDADITFRSNDDINWSLYSYITITFSKVDQGAYYSNSWISRGSNQINISSNTKTSISSYKSYTNGHLYIRTNWRWDNFIGLRTTSFTITKIILE